jgi:hypothetical protein
MNAREGLRRVFWSNFPRIISIALVIADRALQKKKLQHAEIYIFGSLRFGRDDFVSRYNATFGPTTYRFVHGRDIVPTYRPRNSAFITWVVSSNARAVRNSINRVCVTM